MLALSEECEHFLRQKKPEGMTVCGLAEFFELEPRLRDVRTFRTDAEFAFTLTPYVVLEALRSAEEGNHAIYLDADMMFFSSPGEILKKSRNFDVTITPHNFSNHMKAQERYGYYNVGWVGFKKCTGGDRCAGWWAERCLEWCHDRLENGRFADQKYLESFGDIADSVFTTPQPGLNCAPWNASGRRFNRNGSATLVDNVPLVLYHFAKIKRLNSWCIATRAKTQGVRNSKGLNRYVYRPYAAELARVTHGYGIPSKWLFTAYKPRVGGKHNALLRDENLSVIQLIAGLLRGEFVCSDRRCRRL